MACRCPKEHLLDAADPSVVHAAFTGKWFCDICQGSYQGESPNGIMWRCVAGCDYDVCSSCIHSDYARIVQQPRQSDLQISLKVVSQDGNEIFFKIKRSTPLHKLMRAFCNRQGVSEANVRFLFDGTRIQQDDTPEMLEMEDDDVVDVMVAQDIGQWSAAAGPGSSSLAERLLANEDAIMVDPAAVQEIRRFASDPSSLPEPMAERFQFMSAMLNVAQCQALLEHTARAYHSEAAAVRDYKLDLSSTLLAQLIGHSASLAVVTMCGSLLSDDQRLDAAVSPRLILRRRAAAPAERVPFHRDFSLAVVHVNLNVDFTGGQLLLALGDSLMRPEREVGCAMGHNCAVVHGVTRITRGVRYSLFCAWERAPGR